GIVTHVDFPSYIKTREAFAQGKPLRDLAMMRARDHLYSDPSRLVTFLGLHDVQRFMSEPGASVKGLELAFTFLLTARGVPLVYYGDEIAMPGGGDPDNRRDFPGGWKGDARSAFEPGGRGPQEREVFEHVRRLARLRAELPALRGGAPATPLVGGSRSSPWSRAAPRRRRRERTSRSRPASTTRSTRAMPRPSWVCNGGGAATRGSSTRSRAAWSRIKARCMATWASPSTCPW